MKMFEKLKEYVESIGYNNAKKQWNEMEGFVLSSTTISEYLEEVNYYHKARSLPKTVYTNLTEEFEALDIPGPFCCIIAV